MLCRFDISITTRKNDEKILLMICWKKVTAEAQKSMEEKIAGKIVILMQNRWNNMHNDCYCQFIFSDGKSMFLSALDCGGKKKTSED